jgi:2-isopropylmalate synthase
VQLIDYKVRILDGAKRHRRQDARHHREYRRHRTHGARSAYDANIIEASWEALVDSVEYKLFQDEKRK